MRTVKLLQRRKKTTNNDNHKNKYINNKAGVSSVGPSIKMLVLQSLHCGKLTLINAFDSKFWCLTSPPMRLNSVCSNYTLQSLIAQYLMKNKREMNK